MEMQNDKIFMLSLNEDVLSRQLVRNLFTNSLHISTNNKSETYLFLNRDVFFQGLGQEHRREVMRYTTVIASPGARLRALQRQIRRSSKIILLVSSLDSWEKFTRVIQKISKIVAGYVHYRPSPGPRITICIVFISDNGQTHKNIEDMKKYSINLFNAFGIPTQFFNAGEERFNGVIPYEFFDKEIIFGSTPWSDIPNLNIDSPEIVINEAIEIIQTLKISGEKIYSLHDLMLKFEQRGILDTPESTINGLTELNFNLIIDILDKRGVVRFFPKMQLILLSSEWYEKFVSYIFQVMKKYSRLRSDGYKSREYCVCYRSDIVDDVRKVTSVIKPSKLNNNIAGDFTEFGHFINSLRKNERVEIIDAILSEMYDSALIDEISKENDKIIIYPLKENSGEKVVGKILENYPFGFRNYDEKVNAFTDKSTVDCEDYSENDLRFVKWPSYYGPETSAMIAMSLSSSFNLIDVDKGSALFLSRKSFMGNKPISIVLKYVKFNNGSVDMVAFYSLNGRKDFSAFEGSDWKIQSINVHHETENPMDPIKKFINDFTKIWTVQNDFAEFGCSLSNIMSTMSMPIHGFAAVSLDDMVAPPPKGFTAFRRIIRDMIVDWVVVKNVRCEQKLNL